MIGIELYNDGTCYDSYMDEECTYKVEGNSIIVTYSFAEDDPYDMPYNMFEEMGYRGLILDAYYYGEELKLIKGLEDALSYINEFSTNASNIWNYDFAGDYYRASDESLDDLSEYEEMVEMKLAGGGYKVKKGFSLSDDFSGYGYTRYNVAYAVSVDMDKENMTMMLVDPDGIAEEYTIVWSEEIQEWCFFDGSDYWCRLENVE